MKKCPFCAEEIKVEAIKCKHCGSMLNQALAPQVQPPPRPLPVQVRTRSGGALIAGSAIAVVGFFVFVIGRMFD